MPASQPGARQPEDGWRRSTFTPVWRSTQLLLATLTTVVPYTFAAAGEIALMVKEPERFVGHKLLRDNMVAILGFGYAVWAMYATGPKR